jgi:hypothetical protein
VAPLALDLFDGTAWLSVTPFFLSELRPRGLPALPWISEFPEVNVRTYVTLEGKPGVYFFSLDAGNALAVAAARALYHLPYFRASMSVHSSRDGTIFYHSRRTHEGAPPADLSVRYRPTGAAAPATPGSIDHFLVERYRLYAVADSGAVYRAEIHHRPWPLQPVDLEIDYNTMTTAAGISIAEAPERTSFAERLDVVVWAPERMHIPLRG